MALFSATLKKYTGLGPRVILIYLLISFGSINFGFDLSWWASCLGLDSFIDRYGTVVDGEKVIPTSWQSAATGTPNACMAIGCFIGGYCNQNLGRKYTIVVLSIIALIGIVIQTAVPSYWGILVGRSVNAISMGFEANVIPTYSAELAPPQIRGSLVNLYQWWQIVGNIISASCIYGTSMHLTGQWQYKTVMILQLFVPLVLLSGVWFMPESPIWLLNHDRDKEALKSLTMVRERDDEAIQKEIELLKEAIAEQRELHKATKWIDCFKGTNLRRTLIATLVQIFQQIQGNSFMNNYVVIFLEQIGITDSLKIYVAINCTCLAGISLSFYFTDKIGRRPILFFGALAMAVLMYVIAGLGYYTDVKGSSAKGCVAAILIYQAIAGGAWGSCTWITTAETPTAQVREKTMMIATFFSFVMVIIITFVNPYVQNKEYAGLQARVGFIFGSCSLLSAAWVYFFLPEMKGRSLEELDEMFQLRLPTRKFRDYVCTGIGAEVTMVQDGNARGEDFKDFNSRGEGSDDVKQEIVIPEMKS